MMLASIVAHCGGPEDCPPPGETIRVYVTITNFREGRGDTMAIDSGNCTEPQCAGSNKPPDCRTWAFDMPSLPGTVCTASLTTSTGEHVEVTVSAAMAEDCDTIRAELRAPGE